MEKNQSNTEDYILEVKDLSKKYKVRKKGEISAVDSISFGIKRGEIVGLLGNNGAGKTTTIKMICKLITPSSGSIAINGVDIRSNKRDCHSNLSAVLEGNRNLYWRLTVKENLVFFSALKGNNPKKNMDIIDYYIDFFDLSSKKDEQVSKLSRGMQQKLSIATSLVNGSDIIVLDEPTLGLDVQASMDIRRLLKKIAIEENKAILLSSHDMNVVQEICSRTIIINEGKIITDRKTSELLELFKVTSYSIHTRNQLKSNTIKLLKEIPFLEVHGENKTRIDVNIKEDSTFYSIMKILENNREKISSIKTNDVNLEKAFIEILGGKQSE